MRIALFSAKSYDRETFPSEAERRGHELECFESVLNRHTTNLAQGFEAVCVFVNDELDAATIGQLAELGVQLIALRSAGFNHVDLQAARRHDLAVMRVPAYSPEAVAEHTTALLLTLNRKTHKAYNRVRENNFSLERLMGFNLHRKTVGVIGTGLIGEAFCRIMRGFGCTLLAHDLYPKEDLARNGVEYLDLDELFERSHIISLHCPLNPDTHHLIDDAALDRIQDGAVLLNTSRGGLIDTVAVVKALKDGRLGALGIDVYEQEEQLFFRDLSESIIQDDVIARLMTFPNVLITAHQGFFTLEAVEEIVRITLDNIEAFEAGRPSQNRVELD